MKKLILTVLVTMCLGFCIAQADTTYLRLIITDSRAGVTVKSTVSGLTYEPVYSIPAYSIWVTDSIGSHTEIFDINNVPIRLTPIKVINIITLPPAPPEEIKALINHLKLQIIRIYLKHNLKVQD